MAGTDGSDDAFSRSPNSPGPTQQAAGTADGSSAPAGGSLTKWVIAVVVAVAVLASGIVIARGHSNGDTTTPTSAPESATTPASARPTT